MSGVGSAPSGASKPKRVGGVNYDAVLDRRIDDKRHERERAYKESGGAEARPVAVSSTFDAFQRMAAGLEGRKIADKIADPNRPTWEQYKKDNEDKLDMVGVDAKKMAEYRAQLDRDRESKLSGSKRKTSAAISDGESSVESTEKKSKKRKSKKSNKKSSKKKSKVCVSCSYHGECYGHHNHAIYIFFRSIKIKSQETALIVVRLHRETREGLVILPLGSVIF